MHSYNKKRTPKWARKLGLVDEAEFERKKKKSQWSGRYQERNAESAMVGAELAEGEEGANYDPEPVLTEEQERRRRVDREGGLWRREEDEDYYGDGESWFRAFRGVGRGMKRVGRGDQRQRSDKAAVRRLRSKAQSQAKVPFGLPSGCRKADGEIRCVSVE